MDPGFLHVFLGPMFSGKTTRLIREYETRSENQEKVAVINYAGDTRYHESLLSTHDKCMIPCIQSDFLKEVVLETDVSVVLINEGQFFTDIYEQVIEWVENQGKSVYVFALDGDFNRTPFGEIYRLIPLADTVEKLAAGCAGCTRETPARFSYRLSNECRQIAIGCDYVPLCRKCYLRKMNVRRGKM